MMSEKTVLHPQPQINQSGPRQTEGQMRAVDAWLRRDLASRYDPTLAERLPDEILALLRELH